GEPASMRDAAKGFRKLYCRSKPAWRSGREANGGGGIASHGLRLYRRNDRSLFALGTRAARRICAENSVIASSFPPPVLSWRVTEGREWQSSDDQKKIR